MDSCMDLAPEGAEAWRIVEILKDCDGWKTVGGAILIPVLARRDGASRRLLGADQPGTGKTDDRRQFAVDDHHRSGGEPNRSPFRRHDLEAIADGRGVPRYECVEILCIEWVVGHSVS